MYKYDMYVWKNVAPNFEQRYYAFMSDHRHLWVSGASHTDTSHHDDSPIPSYIILQVLRYQ